MSLEDGRRLVVTHQRRRRAGRAAAGRFTDDDLEVVGGEGEPIAIPAHRRVLASASARFQQLVEGMGEQEGRGRLVVEGVTSLALLDVIAFIYTGRVQFRRRQDCRAFMETLDRLEVDMPSTTVCEEEDKGMETEVVDKNSNKIRETNCSKKSYISDKEPCGAFRKEIKKRLASRSLKTSDDQRLRVVTSKVRVRSVEAVYMSYRGSVAKIQRESGAKITINLSKRNKDADVDVEIEGTEGEVLKAEELISKSCSTTESIPLELHEKCMVIGSHGMVMKELQRSTGASVWVTEGMGGLELVVAGSREEVARARAAVVDLLK